MSRRFAVIACASALAASALSGCAIFQANPSATTCANTAGDVAAAQTALTLAETTLAAVQAGRQVSNKNLTQLQADVTAAQTVFNAVAATYVAKCTTGTPSQPPAPAQP